MLNENVKKLLKAGMWDLATCAGGEPNVVSVAFKDVTEDGKLLVGNVFLETTLKNLQANVPFYVKHGFRGMENGAAIQICSYSDKR